MIDQLFDVKQPEDVAAFRDHLEALRSEAIRVESAAAARNPEALAETARLMMERGCVACHVQFRK